MGHTTCFTFLRLSKVIKSEFPSSDVCDIQYMGRTSESMNSSAVNPTSQGGRARKVALSTYDNYVQLAGNERL